MEVKSCGFLIVRGDPVEDFLLMRHADRWDLPKGHVDADETELECALRELAEETGIVHEDVAIEDGFRFAEQYPVRTKSGRLANKTLVIFLARLERKVEIKLTEHLGCQWFRWDPPHSIQSRTIDPVLKAAEQFFANRAG